MKLYMLTVREFPHTEFHANHALLVERAYEIWHQYQAGCYVTPVDIPDTPQGLADYLNFLVHGEVPLTYAGKNSIGH